MVFGNRRRDLPVGHRLICCAFLLAMFSTSAVAQTQPGSTGGAIGKQDKSISGSEERAVPRSPVTGKSKRSTHEEASAGALPGVIRLNEHASPDLSITLTRTDGNTYTGTWSNGYGATFKVTGFTRDSLNMTRQDGVAGIGVSGIYSGRRSANSAKGSATFSHGYGARAWEATWP
jgi:hypothetical protein